MKTIINISIQNYRKLLLAALLIPVAAGCSLNISDDANNNVTEEDLQTAGQIIGEALSTENSGVMLTLTDAMTPVSSDGFGGSSSAKVSGSGTDDDHSGRGGETDFSYSYDPETGTHTVSFTRIVDRPLFFKQVTDTLNYIFTDNNGIFIENPRFENERIESINFNGSREGTVETPRKESFFVRTDTFLIDGVSDASAVLMINGVHNGRGTLELQRPDGDVLQRSYSLEINFLNIEIEKAVAQDGLQHGVTGTVSWEMEIEKSVAGRTESKSLRGTIELVGDGTALLRFRDFFKRFQLNLHDGEVKDHEREFEGLVKSVDPGHNFFTLRNGRPIYITDRTEIDDDDYTTLEQVERALHNGEHVWAEGAGYLEGNRFVATEAEFENADDDADRGTKFRDLVTSADSGHGTFTISHGVTIRIDDQTVIDSSGDYHSLEDVEDALNSGKTVEARGEAEYLPDDTVPYRALEVRFDEEDGDDSDDD